MRNRSSRACALVVLVVSLHAHRAALVHAQQASGTGASEGGFGSPFTSNEAPGPFTFDGFEFGFGGLSATDPNLLLRLFVSTFFNRLFNNPFLGFLTQALPNQVRQPSDFLPEALRERVQREVTQLYGYDVLDRWAALAYQVPTTSPGRIIPAGCTGPIYSLTLSGGNCTVMAATGEVMCSEPTLALTSSPLICNSFYRIGCSFTGPTFRPVVPLSPIRGGYLGSGRPGVYDFGAALNLTRVFLGFNVNTQRVLNDFGVTRWYAYLIAFITFLLLRIVDALISTPLPTLLQRADIAPLGRNGTGSSAAGSGGVSGGDGTSGGAGGGGTSGGGDGTAAADMRSSGASSSADESNSGRGGVGQDAGEAQRAALLQQAGRLLQAATGRMRVESRSAGASAAEALADPEGLLAKLANKAQGAGLGPLADLLQAGLGIRLAPLKPNATEGTGEGAEPAPGQQVGAGGGGSSGVGSVPSVGSDAGPAAAAAGARSQAPAPPPSRKGVADVPLEGARFGTFDVGSVLNPTEPTYTGPDLTGSRRGSSSGGSSSGRGASGGQQGSQGPGSSGSSSSGGDPAVADVYDQLNQQWRRAQPLQAAELDDLLSRGMGPPPGVDGGFLLPGNWSPGSGTGLGGGSGAGTGSANGAGSSGSGSGAGGTSGDGRGSGVGGPPSWVSPWDELARGASIGGDEEDDAPMYYA